MKRHFYLYLLSLVFFFLMSCDDAGLVKGDAPLHAPIATNTAETGVVNTGIFYGAFFNIVDSGLYKLLMSSCKRCGLKRTYTDPFTGGITYHRIYDLFNTDIIQKCSNWISDAYIQIKFDGPGLPTNATVTIKPKSSKRDTFNNKGYLWGEAFSVSGQAVPVNKNKGFNIRLFPSAGLGGSFSLIVRSRSSNHVKKDKLNIDVTYGNGPDENQVLSADLTRLASPAVKSQYTCSQYTN